MWDALRKMFSRKSLLTTTQAGEFTAHMLTSDAGGYPSAEEFILYLQDAGLSVRASKADIESELFPFRIYCGYTSWESRYPHCASEIYEGIMDAMSKIMSPDKHVKTQNKVTAIIDAEINLKARGLDHFGKEEIPLFYAALDVSHRMFGSEKGKDIARVMALITLGTGMIMGWDDIVEEIKIVDAEVQGLHEYLTEVDKTLPKGQSCINPDILEAEPSK